tara:strand:- start:59 stop:628 length:570 start_codon:yes stop_codon:yes gene_type:complete
MEQYKPAIKQGVIMAILSILVFLVLYAIDPMIYAKPTGWIILLVVNFLAIPIVFIILGVRDTKKNFSYFTFGNSIAAGMVTGIVASAIVLVFNILFMTVIDPQWEQQLAEEVLVSTEEFMEKMGAPDEAIEEAMAKAREDGAGKAQGIMGQAKSTLGGVGWYLVLSLIVGAIYRDKEPRVEAEVDEIGG